MEPRVPRGPRRTRADARLTPEGAAFFAAYRRASDLPERAWRDLPRAYWLTLVCNTWPATPRGQQEGDPPPEWTEIIDLRHRAAQWLDAHAEEMADWLGP